MHVYRINACDYINDLSGYGASQYPGRWNSKNVRMLYTAESAALATLECVVHLGTLRIARPQCIVTIQVPDELITHLSEDKLPPNWNEYPAPEALRTIGDQFIREQRYLGMRVPSAVVSDDYNYLLNPMHPAFQEVSILNKKRFVFDGRLLR